MKQLFNRFHWVIAGLFILLWAPAFSAPIEVVLKNLETYIPQAMETWGAPGCAVAIVKGDKIVYIKTFGRKRVDQEDRIGEHTVFPLASLSKNITAVIAAQLIEEEKLHWNDPVHNYLPTLEFADAEATQKVTLQDILSHRVGLPNFTGDTLGYLGCSGAEIAKGLKFIPFQSHYGKEFGYQNIFYGFMGWIIAQVTGKDLGTVYTERLFKPLGMTDASIGPIKSEATLGERLKGVLGMNTGVRIEKNLITSHDHLYSRTAQARPIPNTRYLQTFPSSSGINASISDMGQWLLFWLNGRKDTNGRCLLSDGTVKHMTTSHIPVSQKKEGGVQFPTSRVTRNSYGVGLYVHDYLGRLAWTQMGGLNGVRAVMTILPEEGVGIIVLSNLGGMRVSFLPESIRNKFCDLYLEAPDDVDWATQDVAHMQKRQKDYRDGKLAERLRNPAPPLSDLSAYQGTYENELYGKVEIIRRENSLYLKYRDLPNVQLKHWNGHFFNFRADELGSSFTGVDEGEILFEVHRAKVYGLSVNIMFEGDRQGFRRVK